MPLALFIWEDRLQHPEACKGPVDPLNVLLRLLVHLRPQSSQEGGVGITEEGPVSPVPLGRLGVKDFV